MGENNSSYYAIIPANVRYDNELRANEKLLYGEITALTSKTGECWASNKYFANLYRVTNQAISRWILNLQKRGYITVDYVYRGNSKEIEKRIIKMVSTNIDTGINKCLGGYQQKVKDNNTSDNNTNNNNVEHQNKSEIIRQVIDYMNKCGELENNFKIKKTFKYNPKSNSNIDIITARINEGNTLDDLKDVVYCAYSKFVENEFIGLRGKSSVLYYRPSTLFSSKNFENYKNEYKNM